MTQSKRLSTASAMYDQGNKGYLNKSEKLMRELDADGDGILSRVELEAAAKKIMSAKKTAGQWRLITSMLVVALGVAFGMNLFSNEISKDVKPNADGELLTFNYGAGAGKMVTTQQAEAFTSLLDLPRLSITSLQEVKVLTIVLESGEEWLIRVASISKLECGNSLVIYGQSGDEIHINGATGAAYAMVRDNERHVITAGAFHKRRLAAGNSQVAYSREEFFSNGMGFNNGRRLSKAEGGQQGWASLSQSKNSVVTESPSCPIDYNNSGVVGVGMSDNFAFQFSKIGDQKVMVASNGKSGSVYTEGMMYRFDHGSLDRCREFDLWSDKTDLINGNPGRDDWKFDTQATFEYSASKKTMDFHIPTKVECEVANAQFAAQYDTKVANVDFTVERTEEEKKRNLGTAKATAAYHNKIYAEFTEEWLNEPHNAEAKRMLGGGWGGWNPPSNTPPPLSPNWTNGELANETIFTEGDDYIHYDNPTSGAQFRMPHQCIGIWRGSDEGVDWQHNVLGSWNDTAFAGTNVHGGFVIQFLDGEENFIRDNMASTNTCLRYQFHGNSLGGGLSEVSAEYYGSPSTDLCMQNPTGGATAQAVNCIYMPVKIFTTGCPRVYVNEHTSYGTTRILAGSLRAFHKWDFVPTISPWYYHRTLSKSIKNTSRGIEGNHCTSAMTLGSGYCKDGGCAVNGINLGWISDIFPVFELQGEARISPTARWCSWRTNSGWRRAWCISRYAICRLTDGCYKRPCWNWCYDEHICVGKKTFNNADTDGNSYTSASRTADGGFDFPHLFCTRGLFTNGGALALASATKFVIPLPAPLGNLACLTALLLKAWVSPLLRNFSPDDHRMGLGYIPFYNDGWFQTNYTPFGLDFTTPH